MRFGACVPGSVATTFTISTGFGTRRCGCWMKESNSTFRPPPAALLHASSSDLIQRRAAPMPCVSESVRESVWRSEEHTSELQSHSDLVCRLLLEKKKKNTKKKKQTQRRQQE